MDDLDRLFIEFVDILRRERPAEVKEPFAVSEVTGRIIPYSKVRNRAGFRSNDDYETALSRLLSGERGYVLSEGPMQQELRAGLEEPLPDIRRYRAFGDSRVWLNPEEIPPPGDIRYAPPALREQVERDAEADEARRIESARTEAPPTESYPEADVPAPVAEGSEEDQLLDPLYSPSAASTEDSSTASLAACPECDAALPETALYCPFCGYQLAATTCRSCGSELDRAWRFCARCGTPRPGRPGG